MSGNELPNKDEFREWLGRRYSLDRRSLTDVVSRAYRAMKIAPIQGVRSENELVFRLNESREFMALSETVRSQVKRAALRYLEFKVDRARGKR